jgi:hypothetical protein
MRLPFFNIKRNAADRAIRIDDPNLPVTTQACRLFTVSYFDNDGSLVDYLFLYDEYLPGGVTLAVTKPVVIIKIDPSTGGQAQFPDGLVFKQGLVYGYSLTNTTFNPVTDSSVTADFSYRLL